MPSSDPPPSASGATPVTFPGTGPSGLTGGGVGGSDSAPPPEFAPFGSLVVPPGAGVDGLPPSMSHAYIWSAMSCQTVRSLVNATACIKAVRRFIC